MQDVVLDGLCPNRRYSFGNSLIFEDRTNHNKDNKKFSHNYIICDSSLTINKGLSDRVLIWHLLMSFASTINNNNNNNDNNLVNLFFYMM